jgi:hypothetical protein
MMKTRNLPGLASKSIVAVCLALLVLACGEKVMTADELRSYLREKEHGLAKRIPGPAVDTEVLYWPDQLLFSEGNYDSDTRNRKDIHYFMVQCETRLNNVLDDPSGASLIANGDTVMMVDAISLPQVSTTGARQYGALLAFPRHLKNEDGSGDLVLAVKIAGAYHYVPFAYADIERVQNIKLIN